MKLVGRKVDDSEANDILSGVIHTIATRLSGFYVLNYDIERNANGTLRISIMSYLIAKLVALDCKQVINKFYEWEQELYSTILNSKVFKRLKEDEY